MNPRAGAALLTGLLTGLLFAASPVLPALASNSPLAGRPAQLPSPTPSQPGPGNGVSSAATSAPAVPRGLVIRLTSLSPTIPQPGQTLRVTATVINDSGQPLHTVSSTLLYSPQAFVARSDLDAFARSHAAFGTAIPGSFHALRGLLPAGASRSLSFTVPIANLLLPAYSVGSYPLGVQVSGTSSDGAVVDQVLHTYLPWWPVGVVGAAVPEPLGWLWPIVDLPHRATGRKWLNTGLSREVSAGGRLATLLSAAAGAESAATSPGRPASSGRRHHPAALPSRPVPVTWAIDPMVVDDAAQMAAGYAVHHRPGPGRAAAAAWLAGLRRAVKGGNLLGLPYGDPAIDGVSAPVLTSALRSAQAAGDAVFRTQLHATSLPGYRWPPDGEASRTGLSRLIVAGGRTFILSGNALPSRTQQYTPSARTVLVLGGRHYPALTSDAILGSLVADGATSPSAGILAVQQFAAETLFIDTEQPGLRRAVVITPPALWNPSPGYLAGLLSVTEHAPWLDPMPLASIVGDRSISLAARGPLTVPSRAQQLPPSGLAAVARLARQLVTVEQILPAPATRDALAQGLALGVLRCLSASWQTNPGGAVQFRDAVAAALLAVENAVQVTTRGQITLTSHHGIFPITIENRLAEPVTVRLQFNAAAHARFSGSSREGVAAGQTLTAQVAVTAQTSGIFPVQVQLLTPDGRRLGSPVQLLIHSTAYGVVALGITGGALGALLLAVAIRLTRRISRARRRAAG